MDIEGKSLILRLVIYIAVMSLCCYIFLKSHSPLVLPLFLLLIITRTVMVAVILGSKKKRRLHNSQEKSKN